MAISLGQAKTRRSLPATPYGRFVDEGRVFSISTPKTPAPWTNVLANNQYGLVLSQAGGGFSWYGNCQLYRVTRWEQDLVQDVQGRFLYIRSLDEPGKLWSTTYQPTRVDADYEEIRHGLGYTTFVREYEGVRSTHTITVPLDSPCEMWIVRLENLTDVAKRLRLATYLDWHLGGSGDSHREFHRLFIETRSANNTQIAWKHPNLPENERVEAKPGPFAFISVGGPRVIQWVSNRRDFLGATGSTSEPEALLRGEFLGGNGRWEDPVGSGVFDVTLEPGGVYEFAVAVGVGDSQADALELASCCSVAEAEAALAEVERFWDDFCSKTTLESDEPGVDILVNHWLKYQTLVGRMIGRCAYYQQGGAYGFRDQLQDSLALLSSDSSRTRSQLLINANAMYEDGGVQHWWHPNTRIFAKSHHCDTCLWLAYGTLAYLDETNDESILSEERDYLSEVSHLPSGKGTYLDHCLRGIDRALNLISSRGLPLIQGGDWNDGLSHAGLEGKGESVWLAMFLYEILRRWSPRLERLGYGDRSRSFLTQAESLRRAVETHGWDGEWYLQGYCDDGRPLGSSECKSGQIFLNPQVWAVISGIADDARQVQAMKSVRTRLITDYGALLLAPAYSKVDPWVGYITRYAPGSRENGGVYSHASTWAVQALAMMGDHETAMRVFKGMMPSLKKDVTHYAAEPYVMPGNVDGPDSPNEGRAGWTWYTGSAGWMIRSAFEWLYGVRATPDGLLVEPPRGDFNIQRTYRGDVFDIRVCGEGRNPEVTCDGSAVRDRLLHSTGSAKRHSVSVKLV